MNTKDSYVVSQVRNGNSWMDDDVIRWKSNNRCLMNDATKELVSVGLITEAQRVKTNEVRKEEDNEFLANYNYTPTAEDRAEMKANFEPGTTVVNVITGTKTVI